VSLTVYADFSCADCYLATRRVDALAAAGVEIDWRAVEIERDLPVAGRRLTAAEQAARAARLHTLRGQLLTGEALPDEAPALLPRTEAAVSAYAEAYVAGVAADVRRTLFDLYWATGADIGSPNVLRAPLTGAFLRGRPADAPLQPSGIAVSVDRGPVTSAAYRLLRAWRAEWQSLGSPALPVVLVDGATLSGADAVRRLAKEIAYRSAPPLPVVPEPSRYPQMWVRPARTWVSWVGGPWRYAYRDERSVLT
jgi:hypothetical protein